MLNPPSPKPFWSVSPVSWFFLIDCRTNFGLGLLNLLCELQDLKEAIVKGLGLPSDEFKISGFDLRDALMGHSVAYEFDVEIDNNVLPVRLLEDVNRWDYVDLPIFRAEEPVRPGDENGLIEMKKLEKNIGPVLAPFQLAGPMELWIQDAKDMRLSLPVSFLTFICVNVVYERKMPDW